LEAAIKRSAQQKKKDKFAQQNAQKHLQMLLLHITPISTDIQLAFQYGFGILFVWETVHSSDGPHRLVDIDEVK